jgi:hypothetical protein
MRLPTLLVFLLPTTISAHEVTIVPIRLHGQGHTTIVQVDDVPLKAIIDTSGYHTFGIAPAPLEKLRVRYEAGYVERIDGEGHRFRGREFRVDRLRLGGTLFENVHGYERLESESAAFGSSPFDVSIGRDFLQHFTVVIDYANQQIELHRFRAAPGVCRGAAARLARSDGGVPYSVVMTDAGSMKLAWDTGATYSLIQTSVTEARHLRLSDERFTTQLALGTHHMGSYRMVAMALPGVPDLDGVLGANFFARHRVCLDYGRAEVRIR